MIGEMIGKVIDKVTGEVNDKVTGKMIGHGGLLALLVLLGGCASTAYPPNSTGQSGGQNSTPLKALAQLTELKEELKKLRNLVEEIQFATEHTKRRQQYQSNDVELRLLRLERALRLTPTGQPRGAPEDAADGGIFGTPDGGLGADVAIVEDPDRTRATVPGTAPPDGDAESAGAVSVPEQQAYEGAFNLLKQSKYQDAIAQFQQLVDASPRSPLADDAYYWMSEARYVNREFEAALAGFRTVMARYPNSPRVPEALLKTGYIQYDIGAYQEAAEIFRDLITRFPGHPVAVSAQTRLRRIEQNIQ